MSGVIDQWTELYNDLFHLLMKIIKKISSLIKVNIVDTYLELLYLQKIEAIYHHFLWIHES